MYSMITHQKLSLRTEETTFSPVKITNLKDVALFCKNIWDEDTIELFETAYLLITNNANNIIGYAKISEGGITSTIVDVRKIFHIFFLNTVGVGMILVHNHPSGSVTPSQPDYDITDKLKEACVLLDIVMLDSLIISKDKYYSIIQDCGSVF